MPHTVVVSDTCASFSPLSQIWRRIYEAIRVESGGLAKIRAIAASGPIIFIPTHRSYIDFLIISYICFACNLPMPFIAAG